MSLVINTNLSSLNAQRHLTKAADELNTATERLSSGKRINRAGDDAAGLAISNRLTTQVRGLTQAIRNANDGVSLIQTAEGALDESTSILQRIRELSVQSANGIYSDTDRATLDAEVQQLVAELDRIAETTEFNGIKILDGSMQNVALHVGSESNQTLSLSISAVDTRNLGMDSLSGDFISDNLVLDSDGLLTNAIRSGEVVINNTKITNLAAGSSLDDLVANINENVSDVTASILLRVEAESIGDGVLNGDTLTLTATYTSGGNATFTITDTTTLEELADAITEKTSGVIQGSVEDGKLVMTSTELSTLAVADSSGAASGVSSASSGGSIEQQVINNLTNYWLGHAEDLISSTFGLSAPNGTNIDLIFAETNGTLTGDLGAISVGDQALLVSDGSGGRVAAVWNDPTDLKLIIDLADFVSSEGTAPYYNDRIIAHEMVHAITAALIPTTGFNNNTDQGWFVEGIAEFATGADERVYSDIVNNIGAGESIADGIADVVAAFSGASVGSPNSSEGYSMAYTAVRILNDHIIADSGGTQNITDLFDAMELGADLSTAIAGLGINWGGGGTSRAVFETYVASVADEYLTDAITGSNTFAAVSGGVTASMNLLDTDTGSLGGSDFGGSIKTASSVMPDGSLNTADDFQLNLPSGFTAGLAVTTAQLVLSSTSGEITVERGNSGTLADLAYLGMRESLDPGVINGVEITDPTTAWGAGDIVINGVSVSSANTDSFVGKLDAINAISDQTGVEARMFASARIDMGSFDFTTWSTTPLGDFALNGTVLTGIGNAADTATMIDIFNQFSAETGTTARLLGTDIILESSQGITFSDHPTLGPDAALGFGHPDYGNAKIISAATEAVGGLAEQITDGTSISAGIQLVSLDGSAISLESNASVSTTGWLDVNAATGSGGTSLLGLNITTAANAQEAIGLVDNALENINGIRADLGAVANRLEFTVSNLSSVIENSAAARSRILDADFATETSNLSRAQVISQASQAMLAQANARPQSVLQLIAA